MHTCRPWASRIVLVLLLCGMLVATTGEITAKSQVDLVGQTHVGPMGGGGQGDTLSGGPDNPGTDNGEGDPDDLVDMTLPWLILITSWMF